MQLAAMRVAHANCRTMGLRVSMAGSHPPCGERAPFAKWHFQSGHTRSQENGRSEEYPSTKKEDSDKNSFQKQIHNARMRKNARRAQPHTWTQKQTDTALNLRAKGRKEGARLTQRRADAQGVGVNVNEVLSCRGALPPAS